MRYTKGFSCAPGSGFFTRCPSCTRLLIFGQTCVCGTYSGRSITGMTLVGPPLSEPGGSGFLARHRALEMAPRDVCGACQFEYLKGGEHECR